MKKILIFTAKWPFSNREIDGGSMTVAQYVDILSKDAIVDYLYLEKDSSEERINVPNIHRVEVVDGGYQRYSTYGGEDKFLSRLQNIDYNNRLIQDRIGEYDYVLIVHVLQAMGLEEKLTENELKKIVVLPMFLVSDYEMSGESVPSEYRKREKSVLQKVGRIITPSTIERDYMVSEYNVDRSKISVIPRAISECFIGRRDRKIIDETIDICYVGSFKRQKNNVGALKVLEQLQVLGIPAILHIVGMVQDSGIYADFMTYAREHDLTEHLKIYDLMPQEELSKLYDRMDFSISVSHYETFGRGIFEGLYCGLPTIALDRLSEVKRLSAGNDGIIFVKNEENIADKIVEIIRNGEYSKLSSKAYELGHKFSYARQEEAVRRIFLGDE